MFWRDDVTWHGADGPVDFGHESRCLAYTLRGASVGDGDLCVMVRSREAALAMTDVKFVPVDLALVGIVDELAVQPADEVGELIMRRGWNPYYGKAGA